MRTATEDLLLAYTTGALSEAESLLIATHLALCPEARDQVQLLEALGGVLLAQLDRQPPQDAADPTLAALLGRLDAPRPSAPPAPAPLPDAELAALPQPLRGYAARGGRWKTVVPGMVHQIVLPVAGWSGAPVRLTRVRGGFRVPQHTHRGRELNLVLTGGFHDRGQPFGPGDVADNDEADTHELLIDPGEDCIILAVNEAPLVPVGLSARIASWLTGF